MRLDCLAVSNLSVRTIYEDSRPKRDFMRTSCHAPTDSLLSSVDMTRGGDEFETVLASGWV